MKYGKKKLAISIAFIMAVFVTDIVLTSENGNFFSSIAHAQTPRGPIKVKRPGGKIDILNISANGPQTAKACVCKATCQTVLATGQERYEEVIIGPSSGSFPCLYKAVHECEAGFSRYFVNSSCS